MLQKTHKFLITWTIAMIIQVSQFAQYDNE